MADPGFTAWAGLVFPWEGVEILFFRFLLNKCSKKIRSATGSVLTRWNDVVEAFLCVNTVNLYSLQTNKHIS